MLERKCDSCKFYRHDLENDWCGSPKLPGEHAQVGMNFPAASMRGGPCDFEKNYPLFEVK